MFILCIFFKVPSQYSQTETEVEKENSPYRNQIMFPSPRIWSTRSGSLSPRHGTSQFVDRGTASNMEGKVKVKCILVQALRLCTGRTAYRGSTGTALLFHDHGTRRGERSAWRPGRSLPPGKPRYPLYRRLGRPQDRSGQVRKISPSPGFDPRTAQPVASR